MAHQFNSIEGVVADLQRGKMVIVVDDADRENEGDLIMAGQFVTPAAINFMAKHGRGLICVPTTAERLQQLGIARMVSHNRETFKTDFQVSVEKALNCPGFSRAFGDPDRAVETVAVCGGAGASLIPDAANAGVDAFVTGDVGHHSFLTAEWHGLAVIDAGHFQTEKPGMETLTDMLSRRFAEQGIAVSYVDR